MLLAESTRLLSLKVVLDTKLFSVYLSQWDKYNKELISGLLSPIDHTQYLEYWRVKIILLGKLNTEVKFQPRIYTLSCQSSDFS